MVIKKGAHFWMHRKIEKMDKNVKEEVGYRCICLKYSLRSPIPKKRRWDNRQLLSISAPFPYPNI